MSQIVAASPHVTTKNSTAVIMRDVLIALCPALIAGCVVFGLRALLVVAVTTAACIFFEWGYEKLCGKPSTICDLSAAVTGVLLAMNLPVSIPLWQAVFGALVAMVAVKGLFGGIGKNFVNPALAGRAFMFSWPMAMSTWVKVGWGNQAGILSAADAVTAATPLAAMHQGQLPQASLLDAFVGNVGGCIGETSVLLLLIGFAWLLYRRVITARIPLAYLGTVAVLAFLFPQAGGRLEWMAYQICTGGLMLGAIFMATDYVTSPITKLGQVVYGIGCGVLTILIRYFGGYNEGVSYAILIMNCCVVLLDRIGRPVTFGTSKKEAAKK